MLYGIRHYQHQAPDFILLHFYLPESVFHLFDYFTNGGF